MKEINEALIETVKKYDDGICSFTIDGKKFKSAYEYKIYVEKNNFEKYQSKIKNTYNYLKQNTHPFYKFENISDFLLKKIAKYLVDNSYYLYHFRSKQCIYFRRKYRICIKEIKNKKYDFLIYCK